MPQPPEIDPAERLAVLSFAVRLLLAEGEEEDLKERGVEALREFSGADAVGLYLFDNDHQHLVLQQSVGDNLRCPATCATTATAIAPILESKRPQRARPFDDQHEDCLCVPLVEASNEVSGLVVYRPGEVDATTLQCLAVLQAILAVGLQNARVIADLRDANAKLATLFEARGKLIQHLSHELKTPLSLISASAGLLERPKLRQDDERFARVLGRLRRNVDRLSQIQEEAQDIAQPAPGAGEVERIRSSVDLETLARAGLEEIAPLHEHRGVEVILHSGLGPRVRVPAKPLQKSIVGLVRNAIEATADGGSVSVEISRNDTTAVLAVEDSGVGMDAATLEQVFFGFVHAGRTADYTSGRPYDLGAGGVGLDLLRTKQLAERFGFEVKATSEPGSGSRFELVFPADLLAEEDRE